MCVYGAKSTVWSSVVSALETHETMLRRLYEPRYELRAIGDELRGLLFERSLPETSYEVRGTAGHLIESNLGRPLVPQLYFQV